MLKNFDFQNNSLEKSLISSLCKLIAGLLLFIPGLLSDFLAILILSPFGKIIATSKLMTIIKSGFSPQVKTTMHYRSYTKNNWTKPDNISQKRHNNPDIVDINVIDNSSKSPKK